MSGTVLVPRARQSREGRGCGNRLQAHANDSRRRKSTCRRSLAGGCVALLLLAAISRGDLVASDLEAASSAAESGSNDSIDVRVVAEGTSARATRRDAVEAFPLASLTPEGRRLANGVLDDLSMFRRLPVIDCEADPAIPRYFLSHPEVAVALWRAMEISQLQMQLIAPHRYSSDTGDGTIGTISVLFKHPRRQIVHCEGDFQSPMLSRPIRAAALMDLQLKEWVDARGRSFVRFQADVYVSFQAVAVETAARMISPVSNRIVDRNFQEVATFVRLMQVAMATQPGWVEQMADRMEGVSDEQRRELIDTTARIYAQTHRDVASREAESLTPEALRSPPARGPEVKTPAEAAADAVALDDTGTVRTE